MSSRQVLGAGLLGLLFLPQRSRGKPLDTIAISNWAAISHRCQR